VRFVVHCKTKIFIRKQHTHIHTHTHTHTRVCARAHTTYLAILLFLLSKLTSTVHAQFSTAMHNPVFDMAHQRTNFLKYTMCITLANYSCVYNYENLLHKIQ